MVSGPSCQVCGTPLRWFGEQNTWGCDRCRTAVAGYPPPQQAGYPQPTYPNQPSYPAQASYQQAPAHAAGPALPVAGAAPKSSSKIWIPIVGGVAAIGIIIAVVVATRGGGSGGDTKVADKAESDKSDKSDKSDSDKSDKPDRGSSSDKGDKSDKSGDKADKAGGTPTKVDLGATLVAKMSSFRDRACACKDKPCAETLQAEVAVWTNDQAKNPPKSGEVDDATMKKMSDLASAYIKCSQAAAGILAVGDRVMARWPNNGRWYPGRIAAVRADGTFDIHYDDGDRSTALPASSVRKQAASTASSSSSSTSSTGVSRRPDPNAPCPGPGLTRRCNGVCVNIQENSNHCGGCNNRCPSGKSCDGHMSCRDAAGNL